MNKEDILQKSRKENKKGDEREEKIQLRSYAISAVIGALICMVFIILERNIFDRNANHIWIIYSGMIFSKYLIDAIKLKKKEKVLFSILWGSVCLIHSVLYVMDNVGG